MHGAIIMITNSPPPP